MTMVKDKIPLLKLLISSGLGSRRHVANLIIDGKVAVNDTVERSFKFPVDISNDVIKADGKNIRLKSKKRVALILNKPAGVLSTTSDDQGRKTVLDIIPKKFRDLNVYPAGRLDKDSTGLMVLTNDGDLTFQLTHPSFECEKEYLVHIENKLTNEEKSLLENGIELEDGKTGPAIIKARRSATYNYSIILHEGRKRQVRRMFDKAGHPVLALKRIRIDNIKLGDLKEGKTKELAGEDIELLLSNSNTKIQQSANSTIDNYK